MIHAAAIASLSAFVLVVLLEHALVPELTPARHTISEYANARGAAGPLMVAGFLTWSASLGVTAVLLRRLPARGGARRALRDVLFALLLVAAVGAVVTGLFRAQASAGLLLPGRLGLDAGRLHGFGSNLIRLGLYPAALVSLAILPRPRWFPVTAVTLLLLAVLVGPALAELGVDAPGARQRVQLAAGCGWQFALLAAWRNSPRTGFPSDQ